ncbi:MAG: Lysine 2,3-aminomutase [Chthoniobacteraceae bacterium]|nr:Lysine 2,3-aminomutase [Chthoniobacteraceae bacterium]
MYTDTAHVDPPSILQSAFSGEAPPLSAHKALRRDEFWREIPGYSNVSEADFRSHLFQQKHAVTNVRQLRDTLGQLVEDSFFEDLAAGMQHAPMALRISP